MKINQLFNWLIHSSIENPKLCYLEQLILVVWILVENEDRCCCMAVNGRTSRCEVFRSFIRLGLEGDWERISVTPVKVQGSSDCLAFLLFAAGTMNLVWCVCVCWLCHHFLGGMDVDMLLWLVLFVVMRLSFKVMWFCLAPWLRLVYCASKFRKISNKIPFAFQKKFNI